MILAVSGKISSGKDTIGKIIQYLVWKSRVEKGELPLSVYSFSDFARETSFGKNQSGYEIKKFADKLKDFVCMLIGCTREQLEDQDFKNTPIGEDWLVHWYIDRVGQRHLTLSAEEAIMADGRDSGQDLLTPRLLLQIIGTECIRDKVHPNAWVNALFADYKPKMTYDVKSEEAKKISDGKYIVPRLPNIPIKYWDKLIETRRFTWHENIINDVYPNWIITDMRFPNELEAVKSRGGITIRVNRFEQISTNIRVHGTGVPHESETALDNAEFDYTIENNSTIEDLIQTVSLILTKEKII